MEPFARTMGRPGRPRGRYRVAIAAILSALLPTVASAGGDDEAFAFFEKEVRPLLAGRCFECHGPSKQKGGLRLDARSSLLSGGDSGPAVVEGNPEESLLVQAIRYEDEPRMPPKGKLSDREIAALTRWVAMGVPWPDAKPVEAAARDESGPGPFTEEQRRFWSFLPVREVTPPEVEDTSWPTSPIDRFILARLEAEGLPPAPPADRRTLIRRATFDLTGLPPSPEEVEAFVADEAPDAFARVVDRLLASPLYGQRWGRHWLDLVRYADARDARDVGSPADITEAWRYRDWVVSAFNRDLPYDRFILEQVAGDTLPADEAGGVNAEGLIATGLLTIGEWGTGDADKEKMMTDIVDDQIDVVGRAFLGLTIACARCHDHKFDPIRQEDYYGLAGIFFSTHILPDPGPKTAGSPLLRTPLVPRATLEAAARHKARLAELEEEIKETSESARAALARRLLPETGRYLIAARDYAGADGPRPVLSEFAPARGLHAFALRRWLGVLGLDDGRLMGVTLRDVLGRSGVFAWKGPEDCPSLTVNTNDTATSILTFTLPPRSVAVHPGPRGPVAVAWRSPVAGTVRISGRLADADPAGGDGVAWALEHMARDGRPKALASGDIANGGAQELGADLDAVSVAKGDAIRLVVLPRAHHTCDTTAVTLRIVPTGGGPGWDLAADLLADPLRGNPHPDRLGHAEVWSFLDQADAGRSAGADPAGLLARFDRGLASGDRAQIEGAAGEIQAAIDHPEGPVVAWVAELTSPRGPFWAEGDDAPFPDDVRAHLDRLRTERATLRADPPPPIPMALAAREGGVPNSPHVGIHDARIHVRGSYLRLGPTVPRHVPRILAGAEEPSFSSEGSGRAELARWIARANNPLTARVMVNRIWQGHFGAGLVRTPSNFGKLGEPPTHPELLDYLARRFVASGWSIKAMHRSLMLSSTYRQSSRPPAATLAADPDNRLLGRMPRRRLESEALRDALLSASGRLDLTPGGPAYRDLGTPRRTLYLMTIRSDRASFGPLFDAADATAMVDRRTVSTVAPQALFLLNDPFVLDRARALAERLQAEAADERGRIDRAYALLFGRPATAEEIAVGLSLLEGNPGGRGWEAYCQVLLCANEFLYLD